MLMIRDLQWIYLIRDDDAYVLKMGLTVQVEWLPEAVEHPTVTIPTPGKVRGKKKALRVIIQGPSTRRGRDKEKVVAEINFITEARNAFVPVIAAKSSTVSARTKRKDPPSQPSNSKKADAPKPTVPESKTTVPESSSIMVPTPSGPKRSEQEMLVKWLLEHNDHMTSHMNSQINTTIQRAARAYEAKHQAEMDELRRQIAALSAAKRTVPKRRPAPDHISQPSNNQRARPSSNQRAPPRPITDYSAQFPDTKIRDNGQEALQWERVDDHHPHTEVGLREVTRVLNNYEWENQMERRRRLVPNPFASADIQNQLDEAVAIGSTENVDFEFGDDRWRCYRRGYLPKEAANDKEYPLWLQQKDELNPPNLNAVSPYAKVNCNSVIIAPDGSRRGRDTRSNSYRGARIHQNRKSFVNHKPVVTGFERYEHPMQWDLYRHVHHGLLPPTWRRENYWNYIRARLAELDAKDRRGRK